MASERFLDGRVELHAGDCLAVLATLADNSIDACVTDPPYHLTTGKKGGSGVASVDLTTPYGRTRITVGNGPGGFMGKAWDGGDVAFQVETWAQVLRVLKPGAHLLAFGGTRTYHRLACAIEDAGFEIRDCVQWIYGSGFPKSRNIGNGWGTALKPACEPIVLARKPLSEGTVAANVLKWGTGAINVDGCRVHVNDDAYAQNCSGDRGHADNRSRDMGFAMGCGTASEIGRWPANVIHDGSEEVLAGFPDVHGAGDSRLGGEAQQDGAGGSFGLGKHNGNGMRFGDSGSAARFFYTAKADADDRLGSKHPTVKPLDLMQYLVRLVTPKGGLVLDPFAGTGTTGEAAWREGMRAVLIEREEEYQADIRRRMKLCAAGKNERSRESIKAKGLPRDDGPLFGGTP